MMDDARSLDGRLARLFDWFTGLPPAEAIALRDGILETVMLKPGTLILSSAGILMMSGSAAVLTGARWAIGWFALDLLLLSLRLVPTVRHGRSIPAPLCRRIMGVAACVFLMFGVGCGLSLHYGTPALRILATASMMALVASVATRWAALPRLAVPTVVLACLPPLAALATASFAGAPAAAVQLLILMVGTGLLTLQNQRILVTMLRGERQARLLAALDPLTKAGNRTALDMTLAAMPAGDAVAVLFIDLDRFKAVNDTHGHATGDRLLVDVARRLSVAAAPHPLFRIGGDEFLVLIAGTAGDPAALADRILHRIADPFRGPADMPLHIGASLGIARGIVGQDDLAALMRQADQQLYRAKRKAGRPAAYGDAPPALALVPGA